MVLYSPILFANDDPFPGSTSHIIRASGRLASAPDIPSPGRILREERSPKILGYKYLMDSRHTNIIYKGYLQSCLHRRRINITGRLPLHLVTVIKMDRCRSRDLSSDFERGILSLILNL